jgi:hypothetical protein
MTDPTSPEPARPEPARPEPVPSAPHPASTSPILSIIAMVAGILGLLIGFIGWGLLFAVGAVVLGHLGQRREREARGFWLTGLITGYIGIALNLIVIVIAILAFLAFTGGGQYYYER